MQYRYTLWHGCTLKIGCSEKEGSHQRPYIVCFHLYQVSRTRQIQRRKAPQCLLDREEMVNAAKGYGVSVWCDENVLKLMVIMTLQHGTW